MQMAKQMMAFANKHDNLRLNPGTHIMEEEKRLPHNLPCDFYKLTVCCWNNKQVNKTK